MFFFAVAWSVALGGIALWAFARWLADPSPQNGRAAAGAGVLALLVVAASWWWLGR